MRLFSFVEVELRSRKPTGDRGIQLPIEGFNCRSRKSTADRGSQQAIEEVNKRSR